MAFSSGRKPKASIEILASTDVVHCLLDVEFVQATEERKRNRRAAGEPGVASHPTWIINRFDGGI